MNVYQTHEPVPDGFIVARQAAQILGVRCKDSIYNLVAQGRIPAGRKGKFYFSANGKTFTSTYCWNEAEIRAVAKEGIPAPKPCHRPKAAPSPKAAQAVERSVPAGWLKASEAAKLMGTTINTLVCRSEGGSLPMYRWHQYLTEHDKLSTVRIWNEQELKAHIPEWKKKSGKKVLAGELQALLSRLWCRAQSAKVDGDATDLIFGNPARERDWRNIEALAKAGCLEWSLDNWDRLEISLNPEWRLDEGGERRCFG